MHYESIGGALQRYWSHLGKLRLRTLIHSALDALLCFCFAAGFPPSASSFPKSMLGLRISPSIDRKGGLDRNTPAVLRAAEKMQAFRISLISWLSLQWTLLWVTSFQRKKKCLCPKYLNINSNTTM